MYADADANFRSAAGAFMRQYNPMLSPEGRKIQNGDTAQVNYGDGTSVKWSISPAWKITGQPIDPLKPPTITGAGGGGGGGGGIIGTGGGGPCTGPDCTPTPGSGDNDG